MIPNHLQLASFGALYQRHLQVASLYVTEIQLIVFGLLQPEVAAATVDVETATAVVWMTPEAKATKDWQKQLGEKLANHLTTCGFQSHLQGCRLYFFNLL